MRRPGFGWIVSVVLGAAGCVATASPRISACTKYHPTVGPSSGVLRVVPSAVPGAEIDSARWNTWAKNGSDLVATEGVNYGTRFRFSRTTRWDDLALVYESTDQDGLPVLTVPYSVGHASSGPVALAGVTRDLEIPVRLSFGVGTSARSTQRQCPAAVRLVPRVDIALYMQPSASIGDSREGLANRMLSSRTTTDSGSLQVLTAEAVSALGERTFVGAAVNTADTALADMVIGLVVEIPAGARMKEDSARRDTIEFSIPRVAPHSVIGFVGAELEYRERILARLVYPASRVTGRIIATDRENHRVSEVQRIHHVAFWPGPPPRQLPVGVSYPVEAGVYSTSTHRLTGYDAPRHWTIVSTGSLALLSDTTGDVVVLSAKGETRARVGVTVQGMSQYADIVFKRSRLDADSAKGNIFGFRSVLPDGTIQYTSGCTIHPDGRVEYPKWFPAAAVRDRKARVPKDPTGAARWSEILAMYVACKV